MSTEINPQLPARPATAYGEVFKCQTDNNQIFGTFFQNFETFLRFVGHVFDLYIILRCLGHPEIGTAITKCFEHLCDEKYIWIPVNCILNHPLHA